MGAVLQSTPQRETLWDEHQAIADAIATGEADEAAGLIDDHSRNASRTLTARLEDFLHPQAQEEQA
jgi:DNA-binding GntR family transcriptional regulator